LHFGCQVVLCIGCCLKIDAPIALIKILNYIIGVLKFFEVEMQVVYADKELARCAGDRAYAVRKMGQRRADAYSTRIDALHRAVDLDALKNVAGRFHELTGNRVGQWACDLDHPYRLIFKPVLNSDGNVIGLIVEQTVSILEIVDYHE
jgi:proteic killer suppression protein